MVQEQFPGARTLRWDLDATRGKGSHWRILDKFVRHEADVLIGTQMVVKGLDLPLVTLVGVIAADTALHLPDFRAAERTFQLLAQVAGRAGRSILGGKVIVQTYHPEHYCIQAASRHDYGGFYAHEIDFREEQGYPPFGRLVRLLHVHRDAERCRQRAVEMAGILRDRISRCSLPDVDIMGPAPAFLSRLRGRYRWHILVRAADPYPLLGSVNFPLGWRVDVDPLNVL
jgi:primosomal protein N' (replication factor Y)